MRGGTWGPEARGCAAKASPAADSPPATPRASRRDGFSLPSTCGLQCPPGQAPMTLVAFVRGRRTRSTRHGVQAANGFLLREQEPPCEVLYSSPVQSCSRSRRQRSYLESGLQRTPQCKTSLAEATRLFRKCVNAHLQEKGSYFTHRLHGVVGKHSRRGATPPPPAVHGARMERTQAGQRHAPEPSGILCLLLAEASYLSKQSSCKKWHALKTPRFAVHRRWAPQLHSPCRNRSSPHFH